MRKLILAALATMSLVTSANAGQVRDWRLVALLPDIPSACKLDFDTSDEAFRRCRRPALMDESSRNRTSFLCDDFTRWNTWKERKGHNAPADLKVTGKQPPEMLPTGDDEEKPVFNVFENLPREDQAAATFACNRDAWINEKLDKELQLLHRLSHN